jgi:hypothetical protein
MNEEKKFFSKKNIMGMIIVFLMVFSVLGIWQGSSDALPKYNGLKVTQNDNQYSIKTDKGIITGYVYPSYLEYISLDTTMPAYIFVEYSPSIVVLFDPTDKALSYIEVLRMELAQQLPLLGKTVSYGITQVNETYSYPVVNCSSTTPVIFLKTSAATNTSHIYGEENCLVLEAESKEDLISLRDRLLYTLFGVMN